MLTAVAGLAMAGASFWWPLELLTHFRLQYVVLAIALSLLAIIYRRLLPSVLLVAAIALNAWPLLPYLARPEPVSSAAEPRFSVLSINVNSSNDAHSETIASIRAVMPDLVAVIELGHALDEALLELADAYPYRLTVPEFGNFGLGIVSRHRLIDPRAFDLGETLAIETGIATPAGRLRFVGVHLLPPLNGTMAAERNRQLDALAAHVASIEEPLVVCGDFNLTPYSPVFRRFADQANLTDAGLIGGLGITWPTFMPLLGIPIDLCLLRGAVAADSFQSLAPIGSDHYPVHLSLHWLDPT